MQLKTELIKFLYSISSDNEHTAIQVAKNIKHKVYKNNNSQVKANIISGYFCVCFEREAKEANEKKQNDLC